MKVFLGAHDITDLQNAESRDVVDIITHPGNQKFLITTIWKKKRGRIFLMIESKKD